MLMQNLEGQTKTITIFSEAAYSSQASEGYKLKAECLFRDAFFLCIEIFGISLEALIRLHDAWGTYD